MSYQCTHPVEIGILGKFKSGYKNIVQDWMAIEESFFETHDICLSWSAKDAIVLAFATEIINLDEFNNLLNRI